MLVHFVCNETATDRRIFLEHLSRNPFADEDHGSRRDSISDDNYPDSRLSFDEPTVVHSAYREIRSLHSDYLRETSIVTQVRHLLELGSSRLS